ncbi:MAG: ABC transporter permease, partial [Bacilli bacterium]|nr:ABC transporter permease [Bacilli bacterium]
MRNPLFHIVRRRDIPWWKSLLFRVIAIIIAFVIVCGMISATSGENPAMIFPYLFEGSFGTVRKVYSPFRMMSLLLIVGLALVPAFKMKFWNLGGDGQMLIGCLCAIMCMVHLGDLGWPDWAIILVEIPAAILGGIIWALIPAIFKAFFNTNESLLTLMLNYIAVAVVGVYLTATVKNGSGTMSPVTTGALAIKFGPHQFDYLPIIVAVVLLALVFAYLRFHKH